MRSARYWVYVSHVHAHRLISGPRKAVVLKHTTAMPHPRYWRPSLACIAHAISAAAQVIHRSEVSHSAAGSIKPAGHIAVAREHEAARWEALSWTIDRQHLRWDGCKPPGRWAFGWRHAAPRDRTPAQARPRINQWHEVIADASSTSASVEIGTLVESVDIDHVVARLQLSLACLSDRVAHESHRIHRCLGPHRRPLFRPPRRGGLEELVTANGVRAAPDGGAGRASTEASHIAD